jgi:hypothetical protein
MNININLFYKTTMSSKVNHNTDANNSDEIQKIYSPNYIEPENNLDKVALKRKHSFDVDPIKDS